MQIYEKIAKVNLGQWLNLRKIGQKDDNESFLLAAYLELGKIVVNLQIEKDSILLRL